MLFEAQLEFLWYIQLFFCNPQNLNKGFPCHKSVFSNISLSRKQAIVHITLVSEVGVVTLWQKVTKQGLQH